MLKVEYQENPSIFVTKAEIKKALQGNVQIIIEDTNYKDQLLRKFQALYHVPPRYKEITVVGPPHDRIFTMGVVDPQDRILTTATARNKKVAEQEASRAALELLGGDANASVLTR
jgi:dsRNA-specific ribonuclease